MKTSKSNPTNLLIGYFFITSLIWALLSPLGSVPDEYAHIVYSKMVISGGYSDSINLNTYELPRNLTEGANKKCMSLYPELSASCQTKIGDDETLVNSDIFIRGYPPLFYAMIGGPLLLGFSESIWYSMRILNILFCTFIFGLALRFGNQLLSKRFFYGILIALTPMVSYFVGSVNPSGLEITSGIALALVMVRIFLQNKPYEINLNMRSYLTVFIIGISLSLARPFSWSMSVGIILCVLIMSRFTLDFASRMKVLVTLLITFLIGLFFRFLPSLLVEQSTETQGTSAVVLPSFSSILQMQFIGFDNHLFDSIAFFGYLDHRGLQLVTLFWGTLIILSAIFSLFNASILFKIGLILIFAGSVIVAPIAAYRYSFPSGYGYQARYAMALTCSIPLFAAVNNKSNIFNIIVFQKIVSFFLPIAFISSWIISFYRYSHGLPFEIFDLDSKSFNWWLGDKLSLALALSVLSYLILTYKVLSIEFLPKVTSNAEDTPINFQIESKHG